MHTLSTRALALGCRCNETKQQVSQFKFIYEGQILLACNKRTREDIVNDMREHNPHSSMMLKAQATGLASSVTASLEKDGGGKQQECCDRGQEVGMPMQLRMRIPRAGGTVASCGTNGIRAGVTPGDRWDLDERAQTNQESCSQKQVVKTEVKKAVSLKIRVVRIRVASRLLQPKRGRREKRVRRPEM